MTEVVPVFKPIEGEYNNQLSPSFSVYQIAGVGVCPVNSVGLTPNTPVPSVIVRVSVSFAGATTVKYAKREASLYVPP